jgi:hypothetical protein
MTNPDGGGGGGVDLDPPAAVQDQDVAPETPSQRTLQLWREVAFGIDKNQTGKLYDIILTFATL